MPHNQTSPIFTSLIAEIGHPLLYSWLNALSDSNNDNFWNIYTLSNGGQCMTPAKPMATMHALQKLADELDADWISDFYDLLKDCIIAPAEKGQLGLRQEECNSISRARN